MVNTKNISEWKSKGLSDKIIKPPNNALALKLEHDGKRIYVKFNGSCLKQDKITFNHGKIVNIYIIYEIIKINAVNSNPTIENCLFRASK